jgi:hypothetical protein
MRRWLFVTMAMSLFGLAAGASRPETQAAEQVPPEPADEDVEWIYSCPSGNGCAFSCPTGAGGSLERSYGRLVAPGGGMAASHVTKLAIHLRRLRMGNENAQAIFYEYSTMEVPSGSGFSINTGIGALSCQVTGMTLDYFGPPKSHGQRD